MFIKLNITSIQKGTNKINIFVVLKIILSTRNRKNNHIDFEMNKNKFIQNKKNGKIFDTNSEKQF